MPAQAAIGNTQVSHRYQVCAAEARPGAALPASGLVTARSSLTACADRDSARSSPEALTASSPPSALPTRCAGSDNGARVEVARHSPGEERRSSDDRHDEIDR